VTTPPTEPVVVDCAKVTALKASANKHTKESLTIFDIQGNSLANELTLNALQPSSGTGLANLRAREINLEGVAKRTGKQDATSITPELAFASRTHD
jgi:hypothetical protein